MAEGPERLHLALNLADVPALLPAPDAQLIEAGGGELVVGDDNAVWVSLAPHGWAILSA
ncbi:MAG: hypothetical protein K2Y56_21145 [Methylobacterium sp.]|uniref:hypothetical protein n=1 Tax=Methylobacterium sp. TaxID=409 RepID=UPI0025EE7618|nr:hypothetical protein [Methylobacterium sp.]MBX9933992.1 hypothetical protein [Methylobacterium sp.]